MNHHCKRRPILIERLERRLQFAGLTAQYFDRVDFTDLKLTRTDATVNFSWGSAAPDASMGAEGFAVRWAGQVQPQYTEKYTFYVTSDDGVRLWVDGRLLIDNWVRQSATETSATIPLMAGQLYDIRMDYEDVVQTATATLSWSSASRAKQIIPSSRLFASPSGLAATYFDNADFTGATVKRVDASVNFDWGSGSPDPAIAADTFSARWTGQIVPQYSQTYTFYATTDAGSTATLRVDGKLLIDGASPQVSPEIRLDAGKRYDIQLDYSQNTGSANVKLEWSSPSQARQVIGATSLVASKVDWAPTRLADYTNTVSDVDRPDPGVIFADGYYWMTHTTGGPNTGWPLYQSTDMVSGWTKVGNLLDVNNKPTWMTGSFWAPEIHKINGKFVLTGTSNTAANYKVIVIATASEITGPYTVRTTPIVDDPAGTIDSHVFQDFDGRVYLIWKRRGPSGPQNGSIRMRELDANDPTNFAAGSTEVQILDNSFGGWEKNISEAPWMVRRGGYYYLFYSGSWIDTTYAQGVARATSITGPYTRDAANPILASNETWGGPGHGAYVQDVDGTVWFYYHARHQDNPNFGRVQMLDRTLWTASAWPSYDGSTPSTTQQIGPRVTAVSGSGKYTVTGDVGGVVTNDTIRLIRNSLDSSLLDVQLNGVTKLSVAFAEIQNVTLSGAGGDDTLLLDYSRGEVVPGSGITFNASTGSDTVRIVAASATDTFHLTAGQIVHDTALVTTSGVESISLQNGSFDLDGDLNGAALDASSSTLRLHASEHLAALTLSGATAAMDAGGSYVLRASALNVTAGARLDLADNALIVDYASTSPVGAWNGSAYTGITGLIATGRNGGRWNGSGITTAVAAAQAPATVNGIGVAGSASALNISGLQTAAWKGETVDATTVLVAYTINGNANLDGLVNGDDYFRIDAGFSAHTTGYANGDFDYNGRVDADDYFLIDANYNKAQVAGASAPLITPPLADAQASLFANSRIRSVYDELIAVDDDALVTV